MNKKLRHIIREEIKLLKEQRIPYSNGYLDSEDGLEYFQIMIISLKTAGRNMYVIDFNKNDSKICSSSKKNFQSYNIKKGTVITIPDGWYFKSAVEEKKYTIVGFIKDHELFDHNHKSQGKFNCNSGLYTTIVAIPGETEDKYDVKQSIDYLWKHIVVQLKRMKDLNNHKGQYGWNILDNKKNLHAGKAAYANIKKGVWMNESNKIAPASNQMKHIHIIAQVILHKDIKADKMNVGHNVLQGIINTPQTINPAKMTLQQIFYFLDEINKIGFAHGHPYNKMNVKSINTQFNNLSHNFKSNGIPGFDWFGSPKGFAALSYLQNIYNKDGARFTSDNSCFGYKWNSGNGSVLFKNSYCPEEMERRKRLKALQKY